MKHKLFAVSLVLFAVPVVAEVSPYLTAFSYNRPLSEVYVEAQEDALLIANDGLEFHLVDDNSLVYGGERAELAFFAHYDIGDRVNYQFSFELPDSYAYQHGWEGIWTIIAQWHDQPNRDRGETWDDFPKNSPPLSLHLLYGNGPVLQVLAKNTSISFPIPVDQTITCSLLIDWHYPELSQVDGHCDYANVSQTFSFQDYIMLNDYYHYFKFGLYRDKSIDESMKVLLHSVAITKEQDVE